MTDNEIREAMKQGHLLIGDFSEESLEGASYDMRIGKRILTSSTQEEINLEERQSITLKAGDFALVTTYEKVTLSRVLAGRIGVKSYYARKGVVLLAGLQIDPGFDGVLVLGVYNASPRTFTLEYLAPFCTVEFHRLSRPVDKPYAAGEEQKRGEIPRADKDYLRTLETQTLSDMSSSLRQMSVNVGDLTTTVKTMSKILYAIIIPLLFVIVATVMGSLFSLPK